METMVQEGLSALLIRDLCECSHCRHPQNGQRLSSVLDLPITVSVERVIKSESHTEFNLSDGHVVTLSNERISELKRLQHFPDQRGENSKYLWEGKGLDISRVRWNEYLSDPAVRLKALRSISKLGYVLLSDLPKEPETVLEIIDTFGYTRKTNYGNLFDVRVEENPNNLAFTNLAIAPHTDNPYRNPVPTIQLLHCLRTKVEGGNSGLVDGFKVAGKIRELFPEAFEILSSEPFLFRYESETAILECVAPIIKLSTTGEIVEIRWNDRSMQSPAMSPEINLIFDALQKFAAIANDSDMALQFRINPGECIIFDNTRLLHLRTAFESGGTRHLQGAYADLDSLFSTIGILEGKVQG
ncbi:MAG: TauD/TfdA family dioxygenase [Actinomycetes bacterium]